MKRILGDVSVGELDGCLKKIMDLLKNKQFGHYYLYQIGQFLSEPPAGVLSQKWLKELSYRFVWERAEEYFKKTKQLWYNELAWPFQICVLEIGGLNNEVLRKKWLHKFSGSYPENKLTVNHIDGNKSNNNIENLEWCTQQENVVHALKTGLTIRKKGECAYTARVVGKFLNNVLVKKYNCIDMSKCDGHKINAVRHSIQSGNTHHGFNWKYLDSKPVSRKKYSTNKPFASFKDGEMVKLYNNSIEALEDGLWLSNIYKCIRGGINSYKKLQWKYV